MAPCTLNAPKGPLAWPKGVGVDSVMRDPVDLKQPNLCLHVVLLFAATWHAGEQLAVDHGGWVHCAGATPATTSMHGRRGGSQMFGLRTLP